MIQNARKHKTQKPFLRHPSNSKNQLKSSLCRCIHSFHCGRADCKLRHAFHSRACLFNAAPKNIAGASVFSSQLTGCLRAPKKSRPASALRDNVDCRRVSRAPLFSLDFHNGLLDGQVVMKNEIFHLCGDVFEGSKSLKVIIFGDLNNIDGNKKLVFSEFIFITKTFQFISLISHYHAILQEI